MDSESSLLSSSPAAPSVTGAHLADAVKTFGSIDANSSTDPNAVKGARRVTNVTINGGKPLDAHALFAAQRRPNGPPAPGQVGSPLHERGQSLSGYQPSNGLSPNSHPLLRPPQSGVVPGQPRSPVLTPPGAGPYNPGPQMQQGFRPPQQNSAGFVRPNGPPPSMQPGMPRGMGAYGMHPGPQGPYPGMGYQQQGYYVSRQIVGRHALTIGALHVQQRSLQHPSMGTTAASTEPAVQHACIPSS